MSCFGCSKKYGLFCKEHGCPNCGYSYCAKCLKRPVAVPRQAGKVTNVCLICYDKLSKIQASEKVIDCEALPGTIITKPARRSTGAGTNVECADLLGTGAVAIFEESPPADLGEVLSPISSATAAPEHSKTENAEITDNLDVVISKRLQNLKTADNMPATDADIRARLSNLSGMPQKDYSKKDLLLSTDERTDQQKMNDLLEQFMGETQLDQRVDTERNDAISEIDRRLRALRDAPADGGAVSTTEQGLKKDNSPDTNTSSDNEQDEETVLKGIIEKYLAESRLPAGPTDLESELASSMPLPPPAGSAASTEELPWCNICNEDAVYRCKGCDGELFCAPCYRECHDDDEEYRAHVKETYTAPQQFKEDHF